MIDQLPIFANLPEEHLVQLEAISKQFLARKGSVLFSPGDAAEGFYAVLAGAVRTYRVSPKGKEITLEIAGAGGTLAGASLFTDIYHCHAEALKDSTICFIRKKPFLELMQKDTRLATAWINILSLEIIHLRQRIEELSLKTPKARIASYIFLLSEMQNGHSVTLPGHRKSIATLLGMTHETFYRTAKELEDEGIVRFDGQRIEIVNLPVLEGLLE